MIGMTRSLRAAVMLVSLSLCVGLLAASQPSQAVTSGGVSAAGVLELAVGGAAGVPRDAIAVVLNTTVTNPTAAGFVTVFPCGSDVPVASNLNYVKDQTTPNMVIAKLGAGGKVCFYSQQPTDLIVDVSGYFPAGSGYVPLARPQRAADTRGKARVGGAAIQDVAVAGVFGVPTGTAGIALNVTMTGASSDGFATVFPCGQPTPTASNVNYVKGQDIPNFVISKPAANGTVCVFSSASADVIVDVEGYFPVGTGFTAMPAPVRLLDSRQSTRIAAGSAKELLVTGDRGIPATTKGVALNVTAVGPAADGFITVYPCGQPTPIASNINYTRKRDIANSVLAKPGALGYVCFYSDKEIDLVVDTAGYFGAESGFVPIPNPMRILDTRNGTPPTPTSTTTTPPGPPTPTTAPTPAGSIYVRPGATGRNDGSDWANAYTGLPASLVRGGTYYLADGSYGSQVFSDANSGTAVISIRKATEADHGTNVGWSSTYGRGQAIFSDWSIHTDYYAFEGQRRNANWYSGATSEYGIKVAGAGPVRLDDGGGAGGDNLTFRNIDFQGGGRDTGSGDDVIYGLTGNSDITFQNCALHDSDRTIFLMRGNWRNLFVDHSYMARNTSTPSIHGELLSMTDSTDVVWSNNVMEDIEGTGFIVGINGGVAQNWRIFGNVATHTAEYRAGTGRKGGNNVGVTGFVFIANDASNDNTGNNFFVYNNTIVDVVGTWSGVVIQKGTGNEVRNNVWYNSVRTATTGIAAVSHNWYYNTQSDGDGTKSKVVCTGGCDIFASKDAKDYRLKVPTAAGQPLSAPMNIDPNGAVRGADGNWDRGAFEYST
jgi:hypothetical protein